MKRKPLTTQAGLASAVDYLLREFKALNRNPVTAAAEAGETYRFTGPIETTYLIAASDARPEMRTLADFVCSGDDDEAEIAVCAALLEGSPGMIQLTEGTFYFDGLLALPDGVVLQGAGKSATIIENGSSYGSFSDGLIETDNVSATNRNTIRDIGFVHTYTTGAASTIRAGHGTRIVDCAFSYSGAAAAGAVKLVGHKSAVVNCYFEGESAPIMVDGDDCVAAYNYVASWGGDTWSVGIYFAGSRGLALGNHITGDTLSGEALQAASGSYNKLIGNTIVAPKGVGIDLQGDYGVCFANSVYYSPATDPALKVSGDYWDVSHNVFFHDASTPAVGCASIATSWSKIHHNIFYGGTVYLYGTTSETQFTDNWVESWYYDTHGIVVATGANDLIVSRNFVAYLEDGFDGIRVEAAAGNSSQIQDIQIDENRIVSGGATGAAIRLVGAATATTVFRRIKIRDNTALAHGDELVVVDIPASVTWEDILIEGNTGDRNSIEVVTASGAKLRRSTINRNVLVDGYIEAGTLENCEVNRNKMHPTAKATKVTGIHIVDLDRGSIDGNVIGQGARLGTTTALLSVDAGDGFTICDNRFTGQDVTSVTHCIDAAADNGTICGNSYLGPVIDDTGAATTDTPNGIDSSGTGVMSFGNDFTRVGGFSAASIVGAAASDGKGAVTIT